MQFATRDFVNVSEDRTAASVSIETTHMLRELHYLDGHMVDSARLLLGIGSMELGILMKFGISNYST